MNLYQKNAIAYLKAQIEVAINFKNSGNIAKYETLKNAIRNDLYYCSTIGIFTIEKVKLLLKITEKKICCNNSR